MIETIGKGITLGLLLSIAVGPILFTVIKQSINNGIKGGLAFVIGVSLSDVSLVVATNFFTEIFTSFNTNRTVIGIMGSTFLISVGIYYLYFKKVKVNEQGTQLIKFRKRDYLKILLAGYFMNTLNPGIIIFWLVQSAAFIEHTYNQRFTIFTTALLFVLSADILKVVLAGKLRQRLTIRNIRLLNKINGVILIGFGLALILGILLYKPAQF